MGDGNVLERLHKLHNTPDWVNYLQREEAFIGWMHRTVLKGESIVVHTNAFALEHNLEFDPFGDHVPRPSLAETPMGPMEESMKDVPMHTLVVEDFHKFHRTNDYTQYREQGSALPFEAWYSTQVAGVVSSTMQIAEANGWDFNPVQYQDGHEGRIVKWNAATNELYVRMTKPTAQSGDFSPEDLKLVLRAVLTVSGPRNNTPENRGVMTTDEIMNEMNEAPPEALLRLIKDLTLP